MKLYVDSTLPPDEFNRKLRDAVRAANEARQAKKQSAAAMEEAMRLFARFGWTGKHAEEMAEAHKRVMR